MEFYGPRRISECIPNIGLNWSQSCFIYIQPAWFSRKFFPALRERLPIALGQKMGISIEPAIPNIFLLIGKYQSHELIRIILMTSNSPSMVLMESILTGNIQELMTEEAQPTMESTSLLYWKSFEPRLTKTLTTTSLRLLPPPPIGTCVTSISLQWLNMLIGST